MSRTRVKERRKIIHNPSTLETLYCLSDMPKWLSILLQASKSDKNYLTFLKYLIDSYCNKRSTEKTSIKNIATETGFKASLITKWIYEIYEDIFELNSNQPELFYANNELKVSLFMKSYDNVCSFGVSLSCIPRKFEQFRFPFIKAKIGTDYFFVKNVEHLIDNNITAITICLQGGFANIYREFAKDKAMFEGWIDYSDFINKHDFEIDNELRNLYK